MSSQELSAAKGSDTPYKYEVQDLDISSVTVYKDRAEVKRIVKFTPELAGAVEVIVSDLAAGCDLDSIRVEGTGKASITEVTSTTKLEEKKEVDESAVKSLVDQIADLDRQIKVLEAEQERVSKHNAIIIGLGEQVKTPNTVSEKPKGGDKLNLFSDEGLSGVTKFMTLYGDQLKHCDGETFRLAGEIDRLKEKSAVLQNKRRETAHSPGKVESIGEVSVLLEAKATEEITLFVSYLVTGAKWEPKYDIRAFSEESVVKITYFGLITQKTGEDWTDTKLFLSTAQPSVGGDAPELPTQNVHFKPGILRGPTRAVASKRSNRLMALSVRLESNISEYDCQEEDAEFNSNIASSLALPDLEVLTSEVRNTTWPSKHVAR